MNREKINRVERALTNVNFMRGTRLDAESAYAVSITWPELSRSNLRKAIKTGRIRLSTCIRVYKDDGSDAPLYKGLKADEKEGRNYTFWEAAKRLGLRRHNENTLVTVFDTRRHGAPKPQLEIMTMAYPSKSESRNACFTVKSGYC
jgi:hypothetical protein